MSAIVYLYKKVANEKLKFVVYILQFVNQLDVLPHAFRVLKGISVTCFRPISMYNSIILLSILGVL